MGGEKAGDISEGMGAAVFNGIVMGINSILSGPIVGPLMVGWLVNANKKKDNDFPVNQPGEAFAIQMAGLAARNGGQVRKDGVGGWLPAGGQMRRRGLGQQFGLNP